MRDSISDDTKIEVMEYYAICFAKLALVALGLAIFAPCMQL
jgi:hypothetical protein